MGRQLVKASYAGLYAGYLDMIMTDILGGVQMTEVYYTKGKRIRLGNDAIEIVIDSYTGELFSLINNTTGENLIKSQWKGKAAPFNMEVTNGQGVARTLCPPGRGRGPLPKLRVEESPNGAKTLTVSYNGWQDDHDTIDIRLEYSITVSPKDPETIWHIAVDNQDTDWTVSSIMFPCIYGVYLGQTWIDDELVLPFIAGQKIKNPVEVYPREPSAIEWDWQDYHYIYHVDGVSAQKADDGAFVYKLSYSGPASMQWMDYFEEGQGLYIASYDSDLSVADLHTEAFGREKPGMGFAIRKYPRIRPGSKWNSHPFAIAVHKGDWHWGADRYREWAETLMPKTSPPDWFFNSPGLVAHYDFKYQSGEVVHRFKDIPSLAQRAEELGIDHILLSGWHREGFDNGFPLYTPDAELGSEDEFVESLQDVRRYGSNTSFYVNSRLCNLRFEEVARERDEWAVRQPSGETLQEAYGDQEFAVMCPGAKGWRDHLRETVKRLAEAGASGVYLDQLGMASAQHCFSEDHGHHPAAWIKGYRELLRDIHSTCPDVALFFEGCGDAYGGFASGQLISTFFYWHAGAFPELYKYTFPQQTLVDMVYPARNQVMRPPYVSLIAKDLINRAFVMGSYLWIYDLEEDNSFDGDPKLLDYLEQVIKLRRAWLTDFGPGRFRDDTGMIVHGNATVKRFELGTGGALLAIWNHAPGSGIRVDLEWHGAAEHKITHMDLDGTVEEIEGRALGDSTQRILAIAVSAQELSLVHISRGQERLAGR